MIQASLKQYIRNAIEKCWPELSISDVTIERPSVASQGDYATSAAFKLSKTLQKSPKEIAETLLKVLQAKDLPQIQKIEIAGAGYINFFLSDAFLQEELTTIFEQRETYGTEEIGKGQKVIVEYPSTNIAKPMHIGHSRTMFIGDALANIYEALGYEVIRWDYLGDWGTGFGKIIAAYKLWGRKEEVVHKPIETLLNLYVKFGEEAKKDPALDARAREEFKKLEEGDRENRDLWEWFKKESLKESYKMYTAFIMHPADVDIGESFYEQEMKPLIADLLKKGVAKEDEGAVIVNLEAEGLPNALLQKTDGASLYLTRDLANLRYRIQQYKPEKILYVVANQQALHFQQLFAITHKLGWDDVEAVHIKFGLVLDKDKKKFATREGKVVLLEDVFNEGTSRALAIVQEKNPTLEESKKAEIAHAVAVGALKYNDLKENRNSDISFDWDRILDFTGNSGPYLQYTYARMMQILDKAGEIAEADVSLLVEAQDLALMKHLLNFGEAIEESAMFYLPHYLALYLYELAGLMSALYEGAPILKDENPKRKNARLMLISASAAILKKGLQLLGIPVLDRI